VAKQHEQLQDKTTQLRAHQKPDQAVAAICFAVKQGWQALKQSATLHLGATYEARVSRHHCVVPLEDQPA